MADNPNVPRTLAFSAYDMGENPQLHSWSTTRLGAQEVSLLIDSFFTYVCPEADNAHHIFGQMTPSSGKMVATIARKW